MANFRAKYYSSLALKGVSIISEDLDKILSRKRINVKKLKEKLKFVHTFSPERYRLLFLLFLNVHSPYRDLWEFGGIQRKEMYDDLVQHSKITQFPKLDADDLLKGESLNNHFSLEEVVTTQKVFDELNFKQPKAKPKFIHLFQNPNDSWKQSPDEEDIKSRTVKEKDSHVSPQRFFDDSCSALLTEYTQKRCDGYFVSIAKVFFQLFKSDKYNTFWCLCEYVKILGSYGNQSFREQVCWTVRNTLNMLEKRDEKLYKHLSELAKEKPMKAKGALLRVLCDWVGSLFSMFFNYDQSLSLWIFFCKNSMSVRELIPCVSLAILGNMELEKCNSEEEMLEMLANEKKTFKVDLAIDKGKKIFEEQKKSYTHFQLL